MAKKSSLMGMAAYKRRMDKIPAEIKQEVKREMARQADHLVAQMRAAVPVDTGALRQSIKWQWGKPEKEDMVFGEAKRGLGGEMVITIYAGYTRYGKRKGKLGRRVPIARFVEFGTVNTKAQPFFYPVWRGNKKGVRRNINKSVGKAVKKA